MSNLPRISGQTCVKALAAAGFLVIRQHGGHIILRHQESFAQVIVPDHLEMDRGTLP
jgi:predicted RNA binding protein YcfA (HicA-like mRNA interferase family)